MYTLSSTQRELIRSLSEDLSRVPGIRAVVLGGSHARGRARPDSDIDIGLLYREDAPFSIDELRSLAGRVHDQGRPVVSNFYDWGPWVNGGSWLTIGGQRVDFLYKNLDQLERVIAQAHRGHYEHCYSQHAPFGFYSDTYLAEVQASVVLYDPDAIVQRLKRATIEYPEALRKNLSRDAIGAATFDLHTARLTAAASDTYLTLATVIRILDRLVHALFALNRRYRVNDKTALSELADAEHLPRDFAARLQSLVTHPGSTPADLLAMVSGVSELVKETAALAAGVLDIEDDSPPWLKQLAEAGPIE
jgi:predicted nucleotidyltransferase